MVERERAANPYYGSVGVGDIIPGTDPGDIINDPSYDDYWRNRNPYSFASGTGGNYVDFGAGSPAILHGRERVMTEAEGRAESDRMSALEAEIRGLRDELASAFRSMPHLLGNVIGDRFAVLRKA
jgi:hypothetical protein